MNKKGQVANVAITLVIAAVALIIGVLVFSEVFDALPTLAGTANTTATSIQSTTFDAFNLAAIGLIVLAAVAVLSYIFLLGRRA
jgi:uncharacterized membrane protein